MVMLNRMFLLLAITLVGTYPDAALSQVCFAERVIEESSSHTVWMNSGDLDGDGDEDFVVSLGQDQFDQDLQWYRNDGGDPVQFTRIVLSGLPVAPREPALADLDGDNDLDVITTRLEDSQFYIVWFENDGQSNPVFTPNEFLALSQPNSSARLWTVTGDLDGDGHVDIFVGVDDNMAWYRNDGAADPTFAEQPAPSTNRPLRAVIGDINGDGDEDVLLTRFGSVSVSWLESSGGGAPTFIERTISTSSNGAQRAILADLDQDTDQDVVAVLGNGVYWYENSGAAIPNFQIAEVQIVNRPLPVWVTVGDYDGDGDPDIAATFGNTLAWYENSGGTPPTFSERIIAIDLSEAGVAIAVDFNGDAQSDLLSHSLLDRSIRWYEPVSVLNLTSMTEHPLLIDAIGTATSGDSLLADPEQYEFDCAPIIDDLGASLSFASKGGLSRSAGTITSLSSGSSLEAAPGSDVSLRGRLMIPNSGSVGVSGDSVLISGDLMLDGSASLNLDGQARLEGQAEFEQFEVADISGAFVEAVDVNDDGLPDLVVGDNGNPGDGLRWFKNTGGDPPIFATTLIDDDNDVRSMRSMETGDIDGDGDVDVLVAVEFDDKLVWYENIEQAGSDPIFAVRVISTSADGVESARLADLDGDGDLDVVASEGGDLTVAWYENNGAVNPSFSKRTVADAIDFEFFYESITRCWIADIDSDDDLDIVLEVGFGGELVWFPNNGAVNPSFGFFDFFDSSFIPNVFNTDIVYTDLNGDGLTDHVTSNVFTNELTWYSSDGGFTPTYVKHVIDTFSVTPIIDDFELADVDGDGDQDIIISENFSATRWFENNGAETPQFESRTIRSFTEYLAATSADFDGDGDLDFVGVSGSVDLLRNAFSPSQSILGSSSIDADGDLNVVNKIVITEPAASLGATGDLTFDRNSGLLGGGQLIASTVRSAGEIQVDADYIRTIVGDYSQSFDDGKVGAESGELLLDLGSGGQAPGELMVSGASALSGGLFVRAPLSYSPTLSDTFTLISSAGGFTGQFDVIVTPGLPDGLFLRAQYTQSPGLRGSGSVGLIVDSLGGNGIGLDDPDENPLPGVPTDAVLADVLGYVDGVSFQGPDGLPDLVVTIPDDFNPISSSGQLVILVNAGNGGDTVWDGFSGGTFSLPVGANPVAVDSGDLDNDKDLDLAVVNRASGTVTSIVNNGIGALAVHPATYSVQGDPRDIALRDFDGDGFCDVVTVGADSGGMLGIVESRLNQGAPGGSWSGFGTAAGLNAGVSLNGLETLNIREDATGDIDIAASDGGSNSIVVMENLGGGPGASWLGFSVRQTITADTGLLAIDSGDLDNDKDLDLIAANTNAGTLSILLNDGSGGYGPSTNVSVGPSPRSFAIADLDMDGDIDLSVIIDDQLNPGERLVRIFRNDLDESLGQIILTQASDVVSALGPLIVLSGDVDFDGDDDVVTVNDNPPSAAPRGAPGQASITTLRQVIGCIADLNEDLVVDTADLGFLIGEFGQTGGTLTSDINSDGVVDTADLGILIGVFGSNCN